MKLTILIMTVCLMQVSALTNAQITIDAKQESLRNVLKKISQQSGYDFIYSVQDFKNANPVDLKLTNVSIEKALSAAFYGQPLIYEVSDKTVMVKKQEEKSYLETVIARFQSMDVRGKVVDSLGNGLGGATVSIKNGKGSTTTAANGDFYLKNVEEGALLLISFMGYVTKEQAVSKDFNYVALRMSTSKLDEVQVMAYGKTSRRLSTGNITTITADEIAKQPVDNPLLAMMGRVPNLRITQTSGMPGSAIKIQLRGQNSIGKIRDYHTGTGTTIQSEPLIVIDGVPYLNNIPGANYRVSDFNLNALSFINPNDIESINVLADADATSIYGSRGGNGVILITTKKGKAGATNINVNISAGLSNVARKLELLNTTQYLEMRREAFLNDGLPVPTFDMASIEKNSRNYDLSLWEQDRYTDWQEVLRGGTASNYNAIASISGGTTNLQYLIGGNYSDRGYVFPGKSKWQQGNGHFNIVGTTPDQNFRVSLTGGYAAQKSISSADLTPLAVTLAPNAPTIYKPNGELNWESDPRTGRATWSNPFARLLQPTTQNTNTLTTSADLSYKLASELTAKVTLGYTDVKLNSFTIAKALAAVDPATRATATGSTSRNNNSVRTWTIDPQLNYDTRLSNGRLNVLVGGTLQNTDGQMQFLEAKGYKSDALLHDLMAADPALFIGMNTSSQYKYTGLFGRVNYNWEDKYILNLSGRRDGSSRFGPGKQFGTFWSIGSAWVFSEEKFIRNNLPFLSFGKLRSSYGSSGNDGIGDYGYLEFYSGEALQGVQYQGMNLLSSSGATNPYYAWEDIRKLEVAFELGLFKDKVLLSTAYWRTRSSNQLGEFPLPSTGGASIITVNRPAKIQNSGIDINLSTKNIITKDFNWSTSVMLGLQRNKLLALPDDFGFETPYKEKGEDPIGKPFNNIVSLYEYRGVNSDLGIYQFADAKGKTVIPGMFGEDPIAQILNTNPKYEGGLSNNISYKGFSIDLFVQFTKQLGRHYLYQTAYLLPGFFVSTDQKGNQPVEVLNRWRQKGDITDIQKFSTTSESRDAYERLMNSSLAWTDASFIRLKNISLSYSIPQKWKNKLNVQNVRVYLNAQNLWTITKYKGTDPETQSVSALPPLRTLVAGISLNL